MATLSTHNKNLQTLINRQLALGIYGDEDCQTIVKKLLPANHLNIKDLNPHSQKTWHIAFSDTNINTLLNNKKKRNHASVYRQRSHNFRSPNKQIKQRTSRHSRCLKNTLKPSAPTYTTRYSAWLNNHTNTSKPTHTSQGSHTDIKPSAPTYTTLY